MCELTGDTPDTLKAMRLGVQSKDPRKAQPPAWIEGIHWMRDPKGVIRYNLEEYDKWVEQPTPFSAVA